MSTTHPTTDETDSLTGRLIEFLRSYYREDLGELAQHYPSEQLAIEVSYDELYAFDQNIALDWLEHPEQSQEYADEALRQVELPADVNLSDAYVRVVDLPEGQTWHPGGFSPTDRAGQYVAIEGEVGKASDEYSQIVEAAFECQRCGSMTRIPQTDDGFEEPHECQGCERQGPFTVNFDQSGFIDAQKLRIQTPPEIASGSGQEIDVYVERDLTNRATVGDRATVYGVLHLRQITSGREKTGKFEPYMDGLGIDVEETDHTQIEISNDERQRIEALADGAEGDPLEVAADSLAPKIYGYDQIKRMAILLMVGGSRVVYPTGDADRGDFHMLLLGDPGTAKSKLVDRVEQVAPRSVGVSGKGSREAGITASATQDDFSDGEWTLEAGAFVKANNGVVAIDELDDMPNDVRAAMLEPMSKQRIHINKAGINANLATQAGVIAAGNPKYGRFDPYEPVQEQFEFDSTLLSRFDLIYTLTDQPDDERDTEIAGHILDSREAAKRAGNGEALSDNDADLVEPPVSPDLLRKWIALAKRQPDPTFASDAVKEDLQESFTTLRAANGYDESAAVPVTFRKLEGIVRIAEAAARFEFSETIDKRHAQIATEAVGDSMQDYCKNEDGELDADIQETGTSKSQKEKIKGLEQILEELQAEGEDRTVPREVAVDELVDELAITDGQAHGLLDRGYEEGWLIKPSRDTVRWLGRD